MAETQASAQEQPTEGTTQSPALPPLPDFLQRHSVRTVKQNGEDRTFVVLNHYPLSFQNQEKKAIQELFVEFWLDRQTLQVFVVVNWMSPVGQATTNIFPRAALFGVVCGRGRNPTLRLWPTIFSGKIDVFPGDRRSRLISSMTSVAPA